MSSFFILPSTIPLSNKIERDENKFYKNEMIIS